MLSLFGLIFTLTQAALLSKVTFIHEQPYIKVKVGTPAQTITMLLDTGNDKTILPCIKDGSNDTFHIKQSSTSILTNCVKNVTPQKCAKCGQDKKCMLNQAYGDGASMGGYYFEDWLTFGQIESLSSSFIEHIGCVNEIYQDSNPDDYLGNMGLMHLNRQYFPNIIDQSTDEQNKSFAICFNKSDAYMSIGLLNGEKSIPYYLDQNGFYTIKILDIKSVGFVFNQSYFSKAPIVLDSGSNIFTFGDQQVYESFQSHFQSYVNNTSQITMSQQHFQCVRRNNQPDFFNMFPTYKFQLENGFEFTIEPKNYMRQEREFYCFEIAYFPGFSGIILGTPFMMGWELTFDQTNKQIHFAENCSYKQLSQTLLNAQDITKNYPLDIPIDEPKQVDLGTQNSEQDNKDYFTDYLIIILIIFLIFMIILILYYIRRIQLQYIQYIQNSKLAARINNHKMNHILRIIFIYTYINDKTIYFIEHKNLNLQTRRDNFHLKKSGKYQNVYFSYNFQLEYRLKQTESQKSIYQQSFYRIISPDLIQSYHLFSCLGMILHKPQNY